MAWPLTVNAFVYKLIMVASYTTASNNNYHNNYSITSYGMFENTIIIQLLII